MHICWKRADLLAFRLCCFTLCRSDFVFIPFRFGARGRKKNSIVSVPDHCLFIYFFSLLTCTKMINYGLVKKVCESLVYFFFDNSFIRFGNNLYRHIIVFRWEQMVLILLQIYFYFVIR